jgi:hypothetical protein
MNCFVYVWFLFFNRRISPFLRKKTLHTQTILMLELKTSGAENRHTRDRENLDKSISLDQEGASMCSLQLRKHESTKWLTVGPPYICDAVVPAPHLGFVQVKGSQSFPIG